MKTKAKDNLGDTYSAIGDVKEVKPTTLIGGISTSAISTDNSLTGDSFTASPDYSVPSGSVSQPLATAVNTSFESDNVVPDNTPTSESENETVSEEAEQDTAIGGGGFGGGGGGGGGEQPSEKTATKKMWYKDPKTIGIVVIATGIGIFLTKKYIFTK